MKILSAEGIRALDKYTISHEPVSSIDLMERAAGKFTATMLGHIKFNQTVNIFCGMGNNGSDGLATARLLIEQGYRHVTTYIVKHSSTASTDFLINEERLRNISSNIISIENEAQIPVIDKHNIVIDAIFGSGLSRPVDGMTAAVIKAINHSAACIYSMDVPSGLFCDKPNSLDDVVVQSSITCTFHAPKLSFMFASNGNYVPDFKILDIGLDKEFSENSDSQNYYVTQSLIQSFFRKRGKFSHKGTYGHALIVAGSYGKMGAAVLSVKAALRSGAGLVTAHIPACGYNIMQISNPEAMVEVDPNEKKITTIQDLKKYAAIGIGPAIGTTSETVAFLKDTLESYQKPMVIDADALNIISAESDLLPWITANTILTPHPGEFKRLAGDWKNDLEKLQKQSEYSKQYKVIVVLKGANTSISSPDGKIYFNSTGNAGMAKGGSGDVLTGVITSILAEGYPPLQAAILGAYIHGLAGDYARKNLGQTGMKAMDITYYLPKAFSQFE